jgi:hypothetical protein
MSLGAGLRLGCYEVVGLIGAGGMGEVYRAKDTRLGRDVALKALPESLTQDPERLARFRREAQVLAALNHPHIAGIYGVEETDGHRFLVLEFVDGSGLERLTRPSPVRSTCPSRGLLPAMSCSSALAFPANPRPYDVLPDGRFVTVGAANEPGEQGPLQIQVVLNWFEELKRKSLVR